MARERVSVVTRSAAETIAVGVEIGKSLAANSVLAFAGDLGAGKTTLIKGITAGVTGLSPDEVSSPTFVYLNVYEGRLPLFHFDLYRLDNGESFLAMGFEEFFEAGGICCIEWAERITEWLPAVTRRISLHTLSEAEREVSYE
jgi:tRNA threonylcarbamoyladenosine biosynthesis protein TsaE